MGEILNELLIYGLKFIIMIFIAVGGIFVGKHLRKKKNEKIALQKEVDK